MAIVDASILRSLRITEQVGEKQSTQVSATEEYLIVSDAKNPSFNEILSNTASWANLGNNPLPQLNTQVVVNGVTLQCTSRDLSYYKDNERAVIMRAKFDALEQEAPEPPDGTDPEEWVRITVDSSQITKPAVGWADRALVPAENAADEGNGAQNSAGDPVDGLEEECSLVRLKYTNTRVANPNFAELQRYTNRCNDGAFLGGADYTVRMTGWSAEYDQKTNSWSVSVEFSYNPEGWWIRYFDAGYNEIVNGERRVILDKAGNPVSKPVPLDGAGQAAAIGGGGGSYGASPITPTTLELYPYKIANMQALFQNCRI